MSDIEKATKYLEDIQKDAYLKIGILPFEAKVEIDSLREKMLNLALDDFMGEITADINQISKKNFSDVIALIEAFKNKFPNFDFPIIKATSATEITADDFKLFYNDLISNGSNSAYEHPANSGMVRAVLPLFKKRLKYLQIEYPENIILSTLPHGEVNAWVRLVPDTNIYLILFQDSWLAFMSEAMCIFEQFTWSTNMINHIKWQHLDVNSVESRGMSDKDKIKTEAVSKFTDLISHYLTQRDLYNNREFYKHSDEGYDQAFYKTRFLPVVLFLLGHELGHIHLGHYLNSNQRLDAIENWQKEIEADLFAFQVLIANYQEEEPAKNIEMVPYFIAISYFNIIEILEKSESIMQNGNEFMRYSFSHPKPAIRKKFIMRTVSLLPKENQDLVNSFIENTEITFNSIWQYMKPFFMAMHLEGIRPKQVYEDDLSKIFKI